LGHHLYKKVYLPVKRYTFPERLVANGNGKILSEFDLNFAIFYGNITVLGTFLDKKMSYKKVYLFVTLIFSRALALPANGCKTWIVLTLCAPVLLLM